MIKILCVGKIKDNNLLEVINDYLKRLGKYQKIKVIELKENIVQTKTLTNLASKIVAKDYNIALDLKGEELTSEEFAHTLKTVFIHNSNITFIIGPSLGLNEVIRKKCNKVISFSKFTFPHELFRLILLEQIYRAFKINNHETYHK